MPISPALFMLGAHLLVPVSERVPTLNVEPSCRSAAAIGLAGSQSYDGCMKDETTAREQLLASWQTFPMPDRVRCTGEASMDGIASYVDLLVCLQMSRDAAAAQGIQLKGARRKY